MANHVRSVLVRLAVLSVLVVTAAATGCDSGSSAGSMDWQSVASSSDGTKLVAVATFGNVYTSTDSGASWTQRIQQGLVGVVSSADGMKLVGAGIDVHSGGFFIYTSSDSGATWTQTTAPQQSWHALASSADGTKLVATGLDSAGNGCTYTSSDSGATWTQATAPQPGLWILASSADGTKLVASGGGPDTDAGGAYTGGACIYTSADSGAIWTQTTAPRLSWAPVASSADGTKLVAAGQGIYTSADSGATWTQTTAPDLFWQSVASSSDGTNLVAVSIKIGASGGLIYTSSDSGATWTPRK